MESPLRVILVALLGLVIILAAAGAGLAFLSQNEVFMETFLALLSNIIPLSGGVFAIFLLIVFFSWHYSSLRKAGIAEAWWMEKIDWLRNLAAIKQVDEFYRETGRIFQLVTKARWVKLYEHQANRGTLVQRLTGTEVSPDKDTNLEFLLEEHVVKMRGAGNKKQPCFELNNIPNSLAIREPFQERLTLHIFPLFIGNELIGVLVAGTELGTSTLGKAARRYLETTAAFISSSFHSRRLEVKLDLEALSDPATGCFRYRFLPIFLEREIDRAERTQKEVAVLLVEPDAGEKVMIGAGDEIHKELIKSISSEIRGMDMIFKDAGTGVYLILLGETDEEEVKSVAERIQKSVSRKKFYDPEMALKLDITVRLGAALYPTDATLPANLLEMANQALTNAREKNLSEMARYAS